MLLRAEAPMTLSVFFNGMPTLPQTATVAPINQAAPPASNNFNQGQFSPAAQSAIPSLLKAAQPPQTQPSTQSPMSVDDFAGKIKAQYPQYASLDNQTLTQKILTKYPQYQSAVQQPSQGGGLLQGLVDYGLPIAGTIGGGLAGAAAGLGIGSIPGGAVGAAGGAVAGQSLAEAIDQFMGWKKYTPAEAIVGPLLTGAATLATGGAAEALGPLEGLAGVAARTATQGGIGAAYGAANASLTGGNVKQGALAGGLAGGALQGAGETLSSLVGKTAGGGVPSLLANEALPKQNASDQAKNIADAIVNLPGIGTQAKFDAAEAGNQEMQAKIEPLLAQADQRVTVGPLVSGDDITSRVLQDYPNSNWTSADVQARLQRVAPDQAKLIDKLFSEDGLNFTEADQLKKALYASSGISKAFRNMTDPQLLADKGMAQSTALSLAGAVKEGVPEAADLYAQQGKYIAARNILGRLQGLKGKSSITFPSIVTGVGAGMITGNPLLGIAGGMLERAAESPEIKLGAATLLSRLGQSGAYQGAHALSLPARVQLLKTLTGR